MHFIHSSFGLIATNCSYEMKVCSNSLLCYHKQLSSSVPASSVLLQSDSTTYISYPPISPLLFNSMHLLHDRVHQHDTAALTSSMLDFSIKG